MTTRTVVQVVETDGSGSPSPISFTLTPDQVKRYRAWEADLPVLRQTAIGGAISFVFTPTSLGPIVEAVWLQGKSRERKLDLTDYDGF